MTQPRADGKGGVGRASRRAFLGLGAAARPARDNLDATHEYSGDPIGRPGNLQ